MLIGDFSSLFRDIVFLLPNYVDQYLSFCKYLAYGSLLEQNVDTENNLHNFLYKKYSIHLFDILHRFGIFRPICIGQIPIFVNISLATNFRAKHVEANNLDENKFYKTELAYFALKLVSSEIFRQIEIWPMQIGLKSQNDAIYQINV